MGDEKNEPDHKADLEHVNQQVGVIDATNAVSEMLNHTFLGGGVRFFGKTDFEGHELNTMVDMVESANPEHLETAGKALWDARDAINDAAEELSGHIGRVDWDGEAGSAFRVWGGNLVTHARDLATFAEVAGTQITAAATGLASVRKSMPPRDARLSPKTVADIPAPKRVEGNHEYTAAVTAENHRQEAINQMNRLSSFYAVSEETLAAQQPPVFEPMPGVGVPKPAQWSPERSTSHGGTEHVSRSVTNEQAAPKHHAVETVAAHTPVHDAPPASHQVVDSVTHPDDGKDVGTEIDTAGTLPQEATKPVVGMPPSSAGPGGTPAGTVPPFGSAPVPPFGGPVGRAAGLGGAPVGRTPTSPQGRVSTPGGTSAGGAARGPVGPVGRAAATGQTGARGVTPTAKSPMGRSVTGGMPRSAGTLGRTGGAGPTGVGRTGGAGPAGAARTGGVVGGRPTANETPGKTGPRVPRGTVIGAEGQTGSRTTGERPGQRGVIGAPSSATGGGGRQQARRSTGNPDGVVGEPKSRTSGTRNNGFTSGGAGLARGAADKQGSDRARRRNGSRREESTEDEKRPRGDERRDVPPTD
ncbi:hypothetical protein OIE77_14330 [Streptomyces sp. NBC_01715]|uniref:hypothetical protein n=1 Tax=unclassified Streptomyces TaxID=2593676 RepID=UPI0011CD37D3|nr:MULTISPECIES: hypothetical protein [unclassified Streptomyces]TXS73525.1 hypothetical protein EAO69_20780 [Streptomyces sp. me109]